MSQYDIIDNEKYIAELKAQATPIDYEKLEVEGLLKKKGAWYQARDFNALPNYVRQQISESKIDGKNNLLVKLPHSWEKAQKLYKKATGKEFSNSL